MRSIRWALAILVAAVIASGCGGDSDDATDTAPTTSAAPEVETTDQGSGSAEDEAAEPADEPEPAEETADPDEDVELESPEIAPVEVGDDWVERRFGILGGIALTAPPDLNAFGTGAGRAFTFDDPDEVDLVGDEVTGQAFDLGQFNQSGGGAPLTTVDGFRAHLAASASDVEFTELDPVTLLGRELTGFQVVGAGFSGNFAAEPAGFGSLGGWVPYPYTNVYLTELPDSLVYVTAGGADATELAEMDAVMRAVVSTVTFTAPDGEIPPMETVEGSLVLPPVYGETIDAAPADPIDGGPESLDAAFQPIDAGSYQVLNLGVPFTIEIPEDFRTQPNEPGFVVLADTINDRPYRLDLRMHNFMRRVVPLGTGAQTIGEGVALTSGAEFVTTEVANLDLIDLDTDFEIGGFPAVSFEATMTDGNDCGPADNPCSYAFVSQLSQTEVIHWFRQKVYIIDGPENGPWVWIASAPPTDADDWFARVDELLATIEFPTLDG